MILLLINLPFYDTFHRTRNLVKIINIYVVICSVVKGHKIILIVFCLILYLIIFFMIQVLILFENGRIPPEIIV